MAEIRIPIGTDESHSVHISASFWTRHLSITATVLVGEKEKHQVDVAMDGFIPKLKVSVDGKLTATG